MKIRPIKSESDYQAALREIEKLMDAVPGTPGADRLDVLTTLVHHFEEAHEPILPPDPIDAVLYYIESRNLTNRDLEPHLGGRTKVAEILNRKRRLTIEMIRNLHSALGIPAEILIQPYELKKRAA